MNKIEEEKVQRFRKAIAKICMIGKQKGHFAYNFSDSFSIAIGKLDINDEFVEPWLVGCFNKTIIDFKKDIKDDFRFKIELLSISSELNGRALLHAVGG